MIQLNLYKKLIKYRKIILLNKIKTKKSFKYLLICHFTHLNGLSFKLIKNFFISLDNKLKFKPYKGLFNKFLFNKSYKYFNKNFIFFKFNSLTNLVNLIENFKNLTLIPFIIYPMFILNNKKNILISLKNLNLNFLKINNILKLLIYFKIILTLKKIIIKFFIQLNLKIKKCQL